jgi:hypothetical protein
MPALNETWEPIYVLIAVRPSGRNLVKGAKDEGRWRYLWKFVLFRVDLELDEIESGS